MNTDYPTNSAASNDEMVTEIERGDEHPFPIPSYLMERVRGWREVVRALWLESGQPTFHYGPRTMPAMLGEWEHSLIRLEDITKTFSYIVTDLDDNHEHRSIRTAVKALEHELKKQHALFSWAWATWDYDPVIQNCGVEEPDPDCGSGQPLDDEEIQIPSDIALASLV